MPSCSLSDELSFFITRWWCGLTPWWWELMTSALNHVIIFILLKDLPPQENYRYTPSSLNSSVHIALASSTMSAQLWWASAPADVESWRWGLKPGSDRDLSTTVTGQMRDDGSWLLPPTVSDLLELKDLEISNHVNSSWFQPLFIAQRDSI
jgi:hypothetical protein